MRPLYRLALLLFLPSLAVAQTNDSRISREIALNAEKLLGLDFADEKIDMMLPGLNEQLADYKALRQFPLSNSVPPAVWFNPIPVGMKLDCARRKFRLSSPGKVKMPDNLDDLAFYSI